MIEVRRPDQTQIAGRVELAQDDREGDRVRSAGQRHDHAGVSAKQRVLANELPDALQQHLMGWRLERREGRTVAGSGVAILPILPSRPSCPKLVPEDGLEPSTWRL